MDSPKNQIPLTFTFNTSEETGLKVELSDTGNFSEKYLPQVKITNKTKKK